METTIGVDFYLSEIDVNGKKIKVKRREDYCTREPANPDTNRWKEVISDVSLKSSQCNTEAVGIHSVFA